jgi:hypothetical protein
MELTPPTPVTDWVADSGAFNHTTPYSGSISSPHPPLAFHPHSTIVGNGSILPVTSVDDSVLPRPFYHNDVLVAPDLVQSLLSVRRFTTDNSCSMEFDPFGLSVKYLATQSVIVRYDSSGPLYTILLSASATFSIDAPPYALAAAASTSTWHRRLGHPGPDVLSQLSRSSTITCPRASFESLCHAYQLGRHIRLPFPSSSSRAVRAFDLIHCDLLTSPIPSVSGYKYYLVILDDCTHYSWTFPLRKANTFPTLTFSLMCLHSLVVPSGVSSAIMDVSLITPPLAPSSFLTVSSFECRVPTRPHRTIRLSA